MENKCKKSSYRQLQALVEHMENYPDFARGTAIYGSSKSTTEEQWLHLSKKLNSLGPPLRTVAEWKKTWADLKSRTKKKIAENKKSLGETGGGVFRMSSLTELEQTIDRTLSLNKCAAPCGQVFGYSECLNRKPPINLECTPPRSRTVVGIVTPNRQQKKIETQSGIQTSSTDGKYTPNQPPLSQFTTTSPYREFSTHQLHKTQHITTSPHPEFATHQLQKTLHITTSQHPEFSTHQLHKTQHITTSPHPEFATHQLQKTLTISLHPEFATHQLHNSQFATTSPVHQQNRSQCTLPNNVQTQYNINKPKSSEIDLTPPLKRKHFGSDNELPGCSSAKKPKTTEQLSLIRQQIRISESLVAATKEHTEVIKSLLQVAGGLNLAVSRIADAVEKLVERFPK